MMINETKLEKVYDEYNRQGLKYGDKTILPTEFIYIGLEDLWWYQGGIILIIRDENNKYGVCYLYGEYENGEIGVHYWTKFSCKIMNAHNGYFISHDAKTWFDYMGHYKE